MGNTEVRFVRHADSDHTATPHIVAGRAPHSRLTTEGWLQSIRLGEFWAQEQYSPGIAHSSPLQRAVNTLNIALLVGDVHLEVEMRDELAEQCLGWHEGRARDHVYHPVVKQQLAELGAKYVHPGENSEEIDGQSLMQVSERMAGYLVGLRRQECPPESVVAMTHHIALKGMFSYLELGGLVRQVDPHELQELVLTRPNIDTCSQSVIVLEGGPEPDDIHFDIEYIGRNLAIQAIR